MPHKNQVVFGGHLGNDVDLRFTPSGFAIAQSSLAVSRSKKNDKGEWVDEPPMWLNIKWLGKSAEKFATLKKGTGIIAFGRLDIEEWEKDGEKKQKTVIIASETYPIPKSDSNDNNHTDDDIPF